PTFEFNLSNTNDRNMLRGGVGESLGFGLDVGLAKRLQVGVFFAFPVHPVAVFGDFVANLQANLVPRVLNIRFDVGAERIAGINGRFADSFISGIALPFKVAFGRYVALIGSGTQARNFGWPILTTQTLTMGGNTGLWGGAATQSND